MYHEFPVDYIIGSNVSYNSAPPSEDDVISQITNMLVRSTDFTLPCEAGIIIEPTSEIGTFEFDKADLAIQSGYVAAQEYIDSIRQFVTKRVTKKEVKERRERFRKKIKPLQINTIQTETLDGEEVNYVNRSFMQDSLSQPLSFDEFSKRYFRSYSSNQIKYIFPTLNKSSDSTYALKLKVYPEKPFELSVGGHFSSRPVNTAYIGLSYLDIGKGAVDLHAESYFGKFYGSTKVNLNYDFPSVYSFRATPYFVLNRWDYYRSSSTFFEDTKPSFLVQNEMYYGLKFGIPSSNNAKIELDVRKFQNEDTYYQTLNFSNKDTADVTRFNGESARIDFKLNRLNRKQWASEGASLKASIRYVQGKEKSLAGNTTEIDYDLRKFHRWINASLEGQKYFEMSPFFKLGIYGKAVLNSQSLFSNYTATVLTMTEFSPLPDSRPLFMAEYRAPQFIGGGMNFIFTYNDLFDLRIDPYFFQPFRQIVRYDDGDFGYSNLLKEGTPMVGASLIFHSPIGPLRVSTNFFPKQDQQFVTQLSFGYIIFNDRAIR
jgi:NTE family protein